jgi:hypothetical protein
MVGGPYQDRKYSAGGFTVGIKLMAMPSLALFEKRLAELLGL